MRESDYNALWIPRTGTKMAIPYIFNIQKFSVHDGPGVRTTLFFKGCPLRCRWCHNPESQSYEPECMETKDGKLESVGRQYPIPELVRRIMADQIFYDRSGGGVTFSGGEAMTQDIDYIAELCARLKQRGISVFIDTCGVAPTENFKRIIPFADGFLYDLKFLDSALHERYTGVPGDLMLKNLRFLSENGCVIHLRLLLLKGINDDGGTMRETIAWLAENAVRVQRVHLLSYHDFGRDKYARLGRECTQNYEAPDKNAVAGLESLLRDAGYRVKAGG